MAQLLKIRKMWYSDLRVPCDGTKCPTNDPGPHSHRLRRALSPDKRYAEEKLAEMVRLRGAARRGEPLRNISWEAFKERYAVHSGTKNPKTQYLDRLAFSKLEAAFPLKTIPTPEMLEGFKAALLKSGNRPTTLNRNIRAVKAAINKAIEWRIIDDDRGYKNVKYFREAKGRLHYFSETEIKTLLAKTKGVWHTITLLGFYAGLRRSEQYWLRTANVDFARNRIHIEPCEAWVPKDFERRFVPIHPSLKAHLKATLGAEPYVLGPKRPSIAVMSAYYRKITRRLGMRGSIHTLRHSFGSHCAMNGVDARVLQKWMGHAKLETTEVYSHLSPEHLDKGIEKLPSF